MSMEHLVFDAVASEETVFAYREDHLRQIWQQLDKLVDFLPNKTLWLGFNHDAIPLSTFEEYPGNAGFDQSELWSANFRGAHTSFRNLPAATIAGRSVAFFQSWLYYGFLESFVKKKIEISYLMRHDIDGNPYLYSRNLHFCLQATVFKIRADPNGKIQVSKDIQLDLHLLKKWISRFTAWSHPSFRPKLDAEYPGLMDQLDEVIPAIVRLAEAVERTRIYALPDCPTMGTLTWHYPYKIADRRRSRLRGLGWCPFQIRMLEDTVNQSTIDWIAALEMGQDPQGHNRCTAEDCERNNIDTNTYQQSHICDDHHCQKLFPDLQEVMKILSKNRIPVMCLEILNAESRLVVSASSKDVPGDYIAFSHVWADGLGGSTDKGLNLCQVKRLDRLCKYFKPTSATASFWLDCLCIPSPALNHDIYIQALTGIRDVYINAAAVLVVDKTIEECTVSTPTESLYAHIYLSAWMQRMWTYEEAVLARHLIFVLKDGFHPYKVETWPSMRQTVCVVWQSLATQLHRLRLKHGQLNIGHINRAFRYRLTNVRKEEFLSVSGMLGLDVTSLSKTEDQERTRAFWLMLKWIPFNVPFLDGPKLQKPGFRWAPKTMMYPSSTQMDTELNGEKCECTEDGLLGTYLMVNFDNALMGSAGEPGSIFYVWVKANYGGVTQTDASGYLALLRVYCVQSWPSPADSLAFDTIMLSSETKTIPGAGEWVAGAAFSREDKYEGSSQQLGTKPEIFGTFKYVGRLLIERLQDQELSSSRGTVMFEGSSRVQIDTGGVWRVKKVCIT